MRSCREGAGAVTRNEWRFDTGVLLTGCDGCYADMPVLRATVKRCTSAKQRLAIMSTPGEEGPRHPLALPVVPARFFEALSGAADHSAQARWGGNDGHTGERAGARARCSGATRAACSFGLRVAAQTAWVHGMRATDGHPSPNPHPERRAHRRERGRALLALACWPAGLGSRSWAHGERQPHPTPARRSQCAPSRHEARARIRPAARAVGLPRLRAQPPRLRAQPPRLSALPPRLRALPPGSHPLTSPPVPARTAAVASCQRRAPTVRRPRSRPRPAAARRRPPVLQHSWRRVYCRATRRRALSGAAEPCR